LSSPRSIKETYTHTRSRVLRSSGLNQYKSLCSSWCSSHPLLQDPTHCSILLAGGKNTDSWHVGRGSDVRCFLKLVNLAIDMDHQSLNGVFSHKGGPPQPFFASDAWESPINRSTSSRPATNHHRTLCRLPQPARDRLQLGGQWRPAQGEAESQVTHQDPSSTVSTSLLCGDPTLL
jgi:hypothetical protein